MINPRFKHSTEIQTLIFDKSTFSPGEARSWAKHNGFAFNKIDEKENTIRIRQQSPSRFEGGTFRTIELTDGVKAVIGVPVRHNNRIPNMAARILSEEEAHRILDCLGLEPDDEVRLGRESVLHDLGDGSWSLEGPSDEVRQLIAESKRERHSNPDKELILFCNSHESSDAVVASLGEDGIECQFDPDSPFELKVKIDSLQMIGAHKYGWNLRIKVGDATGRVPFKFLDQFDII